MPDINPMDGMPDSKSIFITYLSLDAKERMLCRNSFSFASKNAISRMLHCTHQTLLYLTTR